MLRVFFCKLSQKLHEASRKQLLCLTYIARDGLWYKIGTCLPVLTEIGSRDPSVSLCNVNMFCIVQCGHQV